MTDQYCDPQTGECLPTPLDEKFRESGSQKNDFQIIYVGDPMCSWCWGLSPTLKQLKDHYEPKGIPLKIVVGGLRPGGGDPWNHDMKQFLKHHWEEVNRRSGQPFNHALFDRDTFNYDTEPPCRAHVAARSLLKRHELDFFTALKEKFYVGSEDPGELSFYKSICEDFEIDFEVFKERFESEEIKQATHNEFVLNRQWGVRGYPSVLLSEGQELTVIANGFSTLKNLISQIENWRTDIVVA